MTPRKGNDHETPSTTSGSVRPARLRSPPFDADGRPEGSRPPAAQGTATPLPRDDARHVRPGRPSATAPSDAPATGTTRTAAGAATSGTTTGARPAGDVRGGEAVAAGGARAAGFGGSGFGGSGFGGLGGFPGPYGRGPRAGRGDIRAGVLVLLAEQPRHGYEIIRELAERSGGVWRPSPGSIYPTLKQLAHEGLVRADKGEGRRVFELTDAGRTYVEEHAEELAAPWDAVGGRRRRRVRPAARPHPAGGRRRPSGRPGRHVRAGRGRRRPPGRDPARPLPHPRRGPRTTVAQPRRGRNPMLGRRALLLRVPDPRGQQRA